MTSEIKERLIKEAREAALHAYAPYSHFRVGAAVLADNKIYSGCNIENASLGLTVCAERVATFKAVSLGATKLEAIAIVCPDVPAKGSRSLKSPCGACRQVIAEFASEGFLFIIEGSQEHTIDQLLPVPFKLRN